VQSISRVQVRLPRTQSNFSARHRNGSIVSANKKRAHLLQ
jgi:hypothetical protein